jgi:hypothetical protein
MPFCATRESIRVALTSEQHTTDTYIVDRVKGAVSMLKNCANEEQRQHYRLALSLVAPVKKPAGDPSGMESKVAARLSVNRNKPPFRDGVALRNQVDADHVLLQAKGEGFHVGDAVLCRHGQGIIDELAEGGSVKVAIKSDGLEHVSEFSSQGNKKGGGRLRHVPISFAPAARKERSDTVSDAVKEKIQKAYEDHSITSPCTKDRVRIRKSTGFYVPMPALLLSASIGYVYDSFKAEHGENVVSFSTFWELRPPNLRKARHETCLCKHCESMLCYEKAMGEAWEQVQKAYGSDDAERDDAGTNVGEDDPMLTNEHYQKLTKFIKLDRRIEKVKCILCKNAFEHQQEACIYSKCESCGVKKVWSQGLRKELVEGTGLKPGVHPVWLKEIQWERYKTAKDTASRSASPEAEEDDRSARQLRVGSIIDLLDEFEAHAWPSYPYHRYTLDRTRASKGHICCDVL